MAFWSALRIKPNNIIAVCFFFLIRYLTREFRVKLHLKTDIADSSLRDSYDIGFRVQFNAE